MAAVALNHLNIRVPQELLESVKDFYGKVLHLEPGPRPESSSKGYWLYAGAQPIVHLSSRSELGGGAQPTGWIDHVAFTCRDAAATVTRLKSMGIEHRYFAAPSERLVQIFVQDPAGVRVELNFPDTDPL